MLGGTTLEAPAGYSRDFVSRFRLDSVSYITDNAAGKNMLYRQCIIAAAVIEGPFLQCSGADYIDGFVSICLSCCS